jgi:twitching motility protein PilI
MATRTDLREFQNHLRKRLGAGQEAARGSKLGFQAGRKRWLVDLDSLSEVLKIERLVAVPLARDWFAGIVNVHGDLYCMVDFSVFAGEGEPRRDSKSDALLISPRLVRNTGLLVDRVIGLRYPEQLTPQADGSDDWIQQVYDDAEGQLWHEVNLAKLVADASFLAVARDQVSIA